MSEQAPIQVPHGEQERERRRVRERERRQSMSSTQREEYLAQRRATYRANQTIESQVTGQALDDEQNRGGNNRIRLTDIRRLARYNMFSPENHQNEVSVIQSRVRLGRNMNHALEQNEASGIYNSNEITLEEDAANVLHNNIEVQEASRVVPPQLRIGQRPLHNSARDFNETMGLCRYHLPTPIACPHCNARLFHHETFAMCCSNGKIVLPQPPAPIEIINLFSEQTPEGRHFRQHIRAYNHVFSFTSMGVHVDENLANASRGVYTFRAQGAIYHKIGSFMPSEANRPRYLQMYIYDTEHEIENRLLESSSLHRDVIEKIQHILHAHNPFVHTFRQLAQRPDIGNCRLIIKEQPSDRRQYSLPSASQVAAIIVGGDEVGNLNGRDIIVEMLSGQLKTVKDIAGYYDPMHYPLLLPYGSYGWDITTQSETGSNVTCCDYYSYMLQIRQNDQSLLLRGGRLLQQYVVDNYVKIETQRLRWISNNQFILRSELYYGLQDSLRAGETEAGNVGQHAILPSSFVGSPRDMYQRYQDAMSLVLKYGKPDLFLTMTCNPAWEEIRSNLLLGQTPQDRPDLLTRVFRAKVEELKIDLFQRGVLGRVVAHVHVFEFQKRGLPHVHMLLILDENDKLNTPDDYDHMVRAEIPNKENEPELHTAVMKHMIHGPCGGQSSRSPCMKDGRCKRNFPKPFAPVTIQGIDSYPTYKRRDGDPVPLEHNGNIMVDNSWVVPYNPWLLLKYDCHINVEICSSIKSVKYLYKYVHKGPDRVSMEVRPGPIYNEVQQFVDARWVCAPEALWKIFKFSISQIYPSVERLQIHLEDMQRLRFRRNQTLNEIMSDERNSMTMLTEFFTLNRTDPNARCYLYREIPEHYRWNKTQRTWTRRRTNQRVIGRIYTVLPSDTNKFHLRILLNHVRGPRSFEDLLTFNGILYPTFKEAAEKRGLLENDDSVRQCLLEASTIRMPTALRTLFVTILVYCQPTGVRSLFEEMFPFMVEDHASTSNISPMNKLLKDLNALLLQHGKRISDFDLPTMTEEDESISIIPKIIEDELSIVTPPDDLEAVKNLNENQTFAYQSIMGAIERQESGLFFLDGPGGSGKTYLYRALLATLRKDGHIAIATATSGIAATILPGGRTAHSRFKIPINPEASSSCSISKQSDLACLIKQAKVILWDEATMAHRHAFEALDRTFRDITDVDSPFGGKVMVFGGDFRQVLPVVIKGTKSEMIESSIVKASFWKDIRVLRLTHNMRSRGDQLFSEFLLRVGDGVEPTINDEMIRLPTSMVIPWEGEHSLETFIDHIFPNLAANVNNSSYFTERAIITPKNEDVDKLNEKIINMLPGEEEIVYSFDSVEDDPRNLYQQEFLNSISPGGLPPHKLTLKKGAPIMLLRNIDPKNGLCNGTRLQCRAKYNNMIDAEILTGQFARTRVFLPRIPLKIAENVKLPFEMIRRQYPIKLCFGLTINKSQGQTIPYVGIYIPDHVFSHGQLYVALSRGISDSTTKILVRNGLIGGQEGIYTRNVVYKDVFLSFNH